MQEELMTLKQNEKRHSVPPSGKVVGCWIYTVTIRWDSVLPEGLIGSKWTLSDIWCWLSQNVLSGKDDICAYFFLSCTYMSLAFTPTTC